MKCLYLVHGVAVLVLTAITWPGLVRAQPSTQPPPVAWQQAGPEARQRADALFAEGSSLFRQWQFAPAEARYREALEHWQHPLVYLYLSRTLEKLGDLAGAYEALQQAMRQQPPPFSAPDLRLAEELRARLESNLARIEVRCEQEGAEVFFNGAFWFIAPGQQYQMARAGHHVITARKQGYAPVTLPVTLTAARLTRVELRVAPDDIGGRRSRPRNSARTPARGRVALPR